MFKLLFLLLLTVITSSNASDKPTLHILDEDQNEITKYTFSDDGQTTTMTCVSKSPKTIETIFPGYILEFFKDDEDRHVRRKLVHFVPSSKGSITQRFNIHKNDICIICMASPFNGEDNDTVITTAVSLEYTPRNKTTGQDYNSHCAARLGVMGAVLSTALIIMLVLLVAVVRYRKKVKLYEKDDKVRKRPPMTPPQNPKPFEGIKEPLTVPPEAVYEQVYGHGAGLKRPKIRPTGATLKH